MSFTGELESGMHASATQISSESMAELTSLLDKADAMQEKSGGSFQCLFVFQTGLHCTKLWPTKYELERHLKTHLGIRPYVCSYCTEARDLWIQQCRIGKEPKVYGATQAHNLKNHVERVHKSQEGSNSSRRGQGRGGQTHRRRQASSDLSELSSTLTTLDLQQGPDSSRGRGRGRIRWSFPRTAPYPAESPFNDLQHQELSGHRNENFLAPYHIPISARARSATPNRLNYEGDIHTQPFYTPQASLTALGGEESPNVYETLAAYAGQHTISSGETGCTANLGVYAPPVGLSLGASPGSSSSGMSSAGWSTPFSSAQGTIHDDPAYSLGQYSFGGCSNNQTPHIPISIAMPNHEPYYSYDISQPIPQHATSSFPPPENTLGLDISIAHSPDLQSAIFEGGDPGEYNFFVRPPYREDTQNLAAVPSSVNHMPELLAEIPRPPHSYATNLNHRNISPDGIVDSEGSAVFPPSRFVFGTQYGDVRMDSTSPYDLEPLFDEGKE